MPAPRRRAGKRVRARKPTRRLISLALDLEEPLNDATDFVRALRLIGQGLLEDDIDNGRAVYAAAWMAFDRLEDLRAAWRRLIKAAKLDR
jgi:hypothetical protein